jgi:hypothetical protein
MVLKQAKAILKRYKTTTQKEKVFLEQVKMLL